MTVFFVTVRQVFIMFSIIAIGFISAKRKKLDESSIGVLTYVYSGIMLPCSIFKAMQFEMSISVLKECASLILISFIVIFFNFLLSYVFNKITNQPQLDKNLYKYCILFSNFGMMGIPIIEGFLEERFVLYVGVYTFYKAYDKFLRIFTFAKRYTIQLKIQHWHV